ncbi:hypothetical protein X801_02646 [Opisthorchis viverrini]|uniref:ADP-ribosylglycohydrolase n=1 Tax=Opisthorchis viverrini TaxID=6198 RepID=A0A1S8X426_OPIVI|nr:hypothetical protein X801_02646 [Opisthorchis viverrini]
MDVRNFVRGVISGGLIGDCYGYIYEDRPVVKFDVPLKLITDTLSGDYFKDGSHRYYGGTVPSVFRENARTNYENPFSYAATLFKGSGSYGNGGAMRVSPLALYGLKVSEIEFDVSSIDK